MGTKLSADDAAAYEALDRLLFRQWDPVGVSDLEEAPDDEYRAYLPGFWDLIRNGASEDGVVHYLDQIERVRITVGTTRERKLDVARKAVALVTAWRLRVRS